MLIQLMKYMGWSWRDVESAPTDLILEALQHMNYQGKWEAKKREIDRAKNGNF